MSISSEITRLQNLRNTLRSKLVSLNLALSSYSLAECISAVTGIYDNGAVNGVLSSKSTPYQIPAGYHNGSGTVSVSAAEGEKIIPTNIKSGISILGVAGTYSGETANLQTKYVTPSSTDRTVYADDGYDALSSVTVYAVPGNFADISSVNVQGEDVLSGKMFVNPNGILKAGTMTDNGAVAAVIDGLTVTGYTIPSGYHSGTGTVSLSGDIEAALAAI